MNLIKTFINRSPIQGLGLFAAEFVPKGILVWKLNANIDVVYSKGEYENLDVTELEKLYLDKYVYGLNGLYCLCGDDARFTNHSDNPNTGGGDFYTCYALKDINIGDEITNDYNEIYDDFNLESFNKNNNPPYDPNLYKH